MQQILNYINGELKTPVNNQWLDNVEPATGKVYSQIPSSDADDVALATKAAQKAFKNWSVTPAAERSRIMSKISSLIEEKLPELAAAESKDNGKPLKLASHVDIPRARDNFHFFATAILHFASESHAMEDNAIKLYFKKPNWCCWMYFTMEPPTLFIYMENCSCFSSWKLCCS